MDYGDELTSLKLHVKHLGDSTALAFRHLTTGLSDLQDATVNVFDWVDRVQLYLDATLSTREGTQYDKISASCPKIRSSKFCLNENSQNS